MRIGVEVRIIFRQTNNTTSVQQYAKHKEPTSMVLEHDALSLSIHYTTARYTTQIPIQSSLSSTGQGEQEAASSAGTGSSPRLVAWLWRWKNRKARNRLRKYTDSFLDRVGESLFSAVCWNRLAKC